MDSFDRWMQFCSLAYEELQLFTRAEGLTKIEAASQGLHLIKNSDDGYDIVLDLKGIVSFLSQSKINLLQRLPFILALAQWQISNFDRELAEWCLRYLATSCEGDSGKLLLSELDNLKRVPFTRESEGKLKYVIESSLPCQHLVFGPIEPQVSLDVLTNGQATIMIYPTQQLVAFALACLQENFQC